MQTIYQDLRFALRQLRRSPGFTLTVLLTLTLAVGATAAMTGILRATLLAPLPYPHPEQLVSIGDQNLRGFKSNGLISMARTADLEKLEHGQHKTFAGLGTFYIDKATLSAAGHESTQVPGAGVSAAFFQTIGVAPLVGRTIGGEDEPRNAAPVVVLSHRLWSSMFSSDPGVVGRAVRLGTENATVIGVMPAGFDLPTGVDEWHAGHITAANFGAYRGDGSRFVIAIGRLAEGETLAGVTEQGKLLASRLATLYPETDAAWGFRFTSLRTTLFGAYRQALLLVAAAVGLVLLVASVNLAGLQLSRSAMRRQEFAIRGALGVSRARLVRQLLTESLLLVAAGSLLGLGAAAILLQVLATQLPQAMLQVSAPRLDFPVLGVTCGVSLLVGVLTAIVPALHSSRTTLAGGRADRNVRSTRLFGRGFTVAQIGLSLVLLTLSAQVLQGLYRLMNTRLGFEAAQVSTCSVDLPWGTDPSKLHRLYSQVESSIAGLPGVTGVGAASALPLTDFSVRRTFDIVGEPSTPRHDAVVAEGRTLTPEYLRAMRIPLLAGRTLTARDGEDALAFLLQAPRALAPAILINQTLALRYFSGSNPVGHRLLWPAGLKNVSASSEIVGVIGDVRGTGGALSSPAQPEVYSAEDGGWPHMEFAIRSPLAPAVLEPEVRKVVSAADSAASVGHFVTLASTLDRSYAQPRLNASLLSCFGAVSLVLVVVGVYGLVAFDVAERTRELGLRLALGATRESVLALVLRGSLRMLTVGLALGVAGSWSALRLLTAVQPGDHAAFGGGMTLVAALLACAVLTASLVPARRAANIDPMQALRSE